ncbi:hypothetical protein BDR07DRAFT_1410182, partial [Suillus spraguei]
MITLWVVKDDKPHSRKLVSSRRRRLVLKLTLQILAHNQGVMITATFSSLIILQHHLTHLFAPRMLRHPLLAASGTSSSTFDIVRQKTSPLHCINARNTVFLGVTQNHSL